MGRNTPRCLVTPPFVFIYLRTANLSSLFWYFYQFGVSRVIEDRADKWSTAIPT